MWLLSNYIEGLIRCNKWSRSSVSTTKSQDQVEGGLLLDVVVAESSSVFELLSSEDESLLIGWNTFLVLDLGLDVLDGVGGLDLKGDGLASQGLYKDLHLLIRKLKRFSD